MTSAPEPIYVTRPHLPPLADVVKLLEGVWDRRILTNGGPLHQQLETELAAYLGVEHLSLFANGTLALLVALKALRLQGEVITSPFSFIATSEALSWNGLEPVFADINPRSFGLDPRSIESRITPRTSAILAVHCYGFPCDVEVIQRLADDYNLRVIYDAAHAFAVDCHCGSLLQHGDLSILSFHATKVFNTFEGGAIISPDAKTKKRIDRLKNFGFVDEVSVAVNGINAKMSELHAAVGLAQLPGMAAAIAQRRAVAEAYCAISLACSTCNCRISARPHSPITPICPCLCKTTHRSAVMPCWSCCAATALWRGATSIPSSPSFSTTAAMPAPIRPATPRRYGRHARCCVCRSIPICP